MAAVNVYMGGTRGLCVLSSAGDAGCPAILLFLFWLVACCFKIL